jgi:hypothetical protein
MQSLPLSSVDVYIRNEGGVASFILRFFRGMVEERTVPNVEGYALTNHRFKSHCSPSST